MRVAIFHVERFIFFKDFHTLKLLVPLDKASRNQGVNMSTVRNYALGSSKIHRSSPRMIHTESPFKDGDRIGTCLPQEKEV